MSRTLILTLAAAATITVASFASGTSYARSGGGGGHSGGGHSSGGHSGGSHVTAGSRGGSGSHGRTAHNGDRHGHGAPEHLGRSERPGRLADHGHGRWVFRDGRWIVLDSADGDVPDVAPVSDASPGLCRVVVYWDADFKGERWEAEQNQTYVGDHWNDQISSIRVISGTWQFYWDADYRGEMIELKPGDYHYVGAHWNDQISSFRCLTTDATTNE